MKCQLINAEGMMEIGNDRVVTHTAGDVNGHQSRQVRFLPGKGYELKVPQNMCIKLKGESAHFILRKHSRPRLTCASLFMRHTGKETQSLLLTCVLKGMGNPQMDPDQGHLKFIKVHTGEKIKSSLRSKEVEPQNSNAAWVSGSWAWEKQRDILGI